MEEKFFDALSEKICAHRISPEETAQHILQTVYMNPGFFGIGMLTPDDKSDFLLFLYPVLLRVSHNFKPEVSSLLNYVQSVVRQNAGKWYQKMQKETMKTQFCYQLHSAGWDGNSIAAEHPADDYIFCRDRIPALTETQKLHLLILACKASVYLTERHIRQLALLTSRTENELWDLKKQLDMSVAAKIAKRNKLIESANLSYLYRFKYTYKLRETSDVYMQNAYKRLYAVHDNQWQKKRARISRCRITPSGGKIAELLQVTPYKVYSVCAKCTEQPEALLFLPGDEHVFCAGEE